GASAAAVAGAFRIPGPLRREPRRTRDQAIDAGAQARVVPGLKPRSRATSSSCRRGIDARVPRVAATGHPLARSAALVFQLAHAFGVALVLANVPGARQARALGGGRRVAGGSGIAFDRLAVLRALLHEPLLVLLEAARRFVIALALHLVFVAHCP